MRKVSLNFVLMGLLSEQLTNLQYKDTDANHE